MTNQLLACQQTAASPSVPLGQTARGQVCGCATLSRATIKPLLVPASLLLLFPRFPMLLLLLLLMQQLVAIEEVRITMQQLVQCP